MIEIQGPRVLLRPFRIDELETVHQGRLRSTGTVGLPDRAILRRRIERSGEWDRGRLDLAIEAEGRLVGEVDVRSGRQMLPPGVCELGIELWADRSSGLGTEAVSLLTEWLHGQGFPRVQAGTDERNAPMRRVFEKLGYELEGTMRGFMPEGEGRAHYALYAHVV